MYPISETRKIMGNLGQRGTKKWHYSDFGEVWNYCKIILNISYRSGFKLVHNFQNFFWDYSRIIFSTFNLLPQVMFRAHFFFSFPSDRKRGPSRNRNSSIRSKYFVFFDIFENRLQGLRVFKLSKFIKILIFTGFSKSINFSIS